MNSVESIGGQRPEKMDGKYSLVRDDVDQDVQTPAQQFQYRTTGQPPHNTKDHCEHQQAVAEVIELPDELKVFRSVRVGQ